MFAFQFDKLNRQGEMRGSNNQLLTLIDEPSAQFVPLYKQYLAANQDGLLWLSKQQLEQKVSPLSKIHFIYLGVIEAEHYFAYRLPSSEALKAIAPISDGLRNLLPFLSEQDAYLANVASALNQWHVSHQHCGYCGAELYAKDSGFVRQCSNQDCTKQHFPRTDPAIIVAITHTDSEGTEKILLGRQASWPEKRYSVIAGFVEPGESLEQAVKREAFEEVGLKITDIEYQNSQPWPFPQSVMLGFNARAITTDIHLKDEELEAANWFSREQIKTMVQKEQLFLPFSYSISRALINNWLR